MAKILHLGVANPRWREAPPSASLLDLKHFRSYHAPNHECRLVLGRIRGAVARQHSRPCFTPRERQGRGSPRLGELPGEPRFASFTGASKGRSSGRVAPQSLIALMPDVLG